MDGRPRAAVPARATTRSSSSAAGPAGCRSRTGSAGYGVAARRDLGGPRRRAACSGAGRSSSGCSRGPSPTRRPSSTAREYQRYDWNSLLADEPELRVDPGRVHGRHVLLPVAARDAAEPARPSPSAPGSQIRYGMPLGADPARGRPGRHRRSCSRRPTASTAAGTSSSRSASPSRGRPRRRASSSSRHYADTRDGRDLRRQAAVHHRQAELRLRARVRPAAVGARSRVCSPSPAKTCRSRRNRWSGVRARYVQPFEDTRPGRRGAHPGRRRSQALERAVDGGSGSTSAAPTTASRWASRPTRSSPRPGSRARSWTCRRSASRRSARAKLPALTPFWESATVPGIYFAGTIGQASPGLKKHGIPANSGAVHGRRYNARILARHIAETYFGIEVERPVIAPGDVVAVPPRARRRAPELWHQKAFLARVLTARPDGGHQRRGHPAAGPRAGRARRRHGRDDRRGRRHGGDLPGRLHPPRRAARGAPAARGIRCSTSRPTTRQELAESSAALIPSRGGGATLVYPSLLGLPPPPCRAFDTRLRIRLHRYSLAVDGYPPAIASGG